MSGYIGWSNLPEGKWPVTLDFVGKGRAHAHNNLERPVILSATSTFCPPPIFFALKIIYESTPVDTSDMPGNQMCSDRISLRSFIWPYFGKAPLSFLRDLIDGYPLKVLPAWAMPQCDHFIGLLRFVRLAFKTFYIVFLMIIILH